MPLVAPGLYTPGYTRGAPTRGCAPFHLSWPITIGVLTRAEPRMDRGAAQPPLPLVAPGLRLATRGAHLQGATPLFTYHGRLPSVYWPAPNRGWRGKGGTAD